MLGLLIIVTSKLYAKSFMFFRSKDLFNGLKKTGAFPALIKGPYVAKNEKLVNLSKINTKQTLNANARKVIYTCVTAGYDRVAPLFFKPAGCDFLLFTDDPEIMVDGWTTIEIPNPYNLSAIQLARMLKILPHRFLKEYDYSIWLDASYDIIGDISELFFYLNDNVLALFEHFEKIKTINDEAKAIINSSKADPNAINKQVQSYYNKGYRDKGKILETGIIIRKHYDLLLMETMEMWWNEIKNHTHRDQISLPFILWLTGLNPHIIHGNNRKSNLFVRRNHF